MPRKPNPIIRNLNSVNDLFPRNTDWRKALPGWLFQGILEGLLGHVPAYKREALHGSIEFLIDALIWPFENHPEEKRRWTEKRKKEAVTRYLCCLQWKRGMPPDHAQMVFLKHAITVEDYLKCNPFPFRQSWKPKQGKWIKDHLPDLLKTLKQLPFQCGDKCRGRTSAPSQDELEDIWQHNRSSAKLLPMILAHYHRVKPATAIKQIQPPKAKTDALPPSHNRLRIWPTKPGMPWEEQTMVNRTNFAIHLCDLD